MVQEKIHTLTLLLGGNIGDVSQTIQKACSLLSSRIGNIVLRSALYESESWGFTDKRNFINQAITMHTNLEAEQCLEICLHIEKELGRVRNTTMGYTSRSIDIDILFFNSDVIELPHLQVPHPHIEKRRFALMPLVEILPGFKHPVSYKTVTELLKICPDKGKVTVLF